MKTLKNLNINGSISNLVGLWALIRNEQGKIKYRAFVIGKADCDHFLIQGISALTGEPNVIKIVHLLDMIAWDFYNNPELLKDECAREFEEGSVRYKMEIPSSSTK